MDSSPVLRQQSQNKIHSDFLRMKNENNKMPAHPKPSKVLSAPHFSNRDNENRDPGHVEVSRKTPVRSGVSRLPVLAKSLRLQTPSDFSQSHCRWEEKPLAGKAKKKKPCTRPLPFNLSQPKSSRVATENQQPLTISQLRTGTAVLHPDNKTRDAHPKTPNNYTKPTKDQTSGSVDSTKPTWRSDGMATENTSQLSGRTGLFPLSAIPNNALQQIAATSSAKGFNAEACLVNMNLLSLKDPTKTSNSSQNTQLTAQSNFSKSSTDKGENFQPDHAALLSILRNEGVSAAQGSATPQTKPYNYLPKRVSVMKSRQTAGPATGSVRSVQFSPDSTALQSILQNEGVKLVLAGATPRSAVRPPGRGTSIYTAQRVPARKNRVEATGGAVAGELKETPLNKWTPQRVRNTRHQPMSAMKWHASMQQSPCAATPGLQSCKTKLQPREEVGAGDQEVVQRLFDEQEDERKTNVTDEDPKTRADQLPAQAPATESHSEERIETSSTNSDEDEDEEQRNLQTFFQAPPRESVIFFSTGKKLLRAPRFGQKEQQQHEPESSEQRTALPAGEETTAVSGPPSLHRDLGIQKTCAVASSAVAMLRKRLPPLEELRMDEEVATYTSVCVPAAPGFLPPRPRCGNPLASILYFEESSRFVPISCDFSSGSAPSPPSSPLQER